MWPGNGAANGRLAQVGHAASPTAGRVTWLPCRHPHSWHVLAFAAPTAAADHLQNLALISTLSCFLGGKAKEKAKEIVVMIVYM
jgi:hypothetical protein